MFQIYRRLQPQSRSYAPLRNNGPLAPRVRNQAGFGQRLKGFRVWSRNYLVDKGLIESRQQKHDRRLDRQLAFLDGFALILNKHAGAAALQAVLRDKDLSSMLALKPVKQSKPEGDPARHATRVGLKIQDGQVTVCQENVKIGTTMRRQGDVDEDVQPLDASAMDDLRMALNSYVTEDALARQGF